MKFKAQYVQYGIQAFAKFKRPECARLHLRELRSQNFLGGACARNSLEKCAVRNPDDRYHSRSSERQVKLDYEQSL